MDTEEISDNMINISGPRNRGYVHSIPVDELLRLENEILHLRSVVEIYCKLHGARFGYSLILVEQIENILEKLRLAAGRYTDVAESVKVLEERLNDLDDCDDSIQAMDNWNEHTRIMFPSHEEVKIPEWFRSDQVHFQNSAFASAPDIGRSHCQLDDCDDSIQAIDNRNEHFARIMFPSHEEVKIPEWFRRAQQVHSQNSAFASAPDIGRSHLFTSTSRALNSAATPGTASSWYFNRQETLNRPEIRIEILDGDDNQRGETRMANVFPTRMADVFSSRMADVCSTATNSTLASLSSYYGLTCDGWTHVPARAHRICSVAQPNTEGTSKGAELTHASLVILRNDYHQALPVGPDKAKFQTKINNIILGITGQAAVALVSSSSSDSPFLRFFAAATGIGFLGSFFANYVLKKPKIARNLSKIGAIGAASAVIIALGLYFPKDTKWKLNIVATVAACLTNAVMVAIS